MRDHKTVERYDRSQTNRERERDKRSQGNSEMRYLKAVCLYIYRKENKALERDEMSQGSTER